MRDWTNGFERRARTKKVRALCLAIRISAPQADRRHLGRWAAKATARDRQIVAQIAKVWIPSDATWIRVTRSLNVYRGR